MKKNDVQKKIAEITTTGEMWRQLPFAPRYWVSSHGRIYGTSHSRVLKPEGKRYKRVFIRTIAGYKHFLVHKLVAMMFCYGYDDFKEIHHIDLNPANNDCTNLAPVTPEQHRLIHISHKKSA